jgi:hypothetical protein
MTMSMAIVTSSGYAQKEFSKEYHEEFQVNPGAILKTESSFSEIKISTWNKNIISVSIFAIADAKNQDAAEDLIDKLTVTIKGATDEVSIKTQLDNNWSWGNKKNTSNLDIRIEVKAPAHVKLRLEHSFGDMEIDSFTGNARIDVEYGKMTATELLGQNNDVEVSFGDGEISAFGGGQIEVEYGEARIGSLAYDTEIECAYGNLKVDSVKEGCKKLDLDCAYGDIKVGVSESGAYTFEGKSSFGNVKIPDGVKPSSNSDEYFSSEMRATHGSSSSPTVITANASFGDVKIYWNK